MKIFNKINSILLFLVTLFFSCQENESPTPSSTGEMIVKFDNYVGIQPMVIDGVGSTDYRYTNSFNQTFNLTRFGYYVSHVRLEGPNGEVFTDEMNASADADETRGYYQLPVSQSFNSDQHVHIESKGRFSLAFIAFIGKKSNANIFTTQ